MYQRQKKAKFTVQKKKKNKGKKKKKLKNKKKKKKFPQQWRGKTAISNTEERDHEGEILRQTQYL